MSRITGSDAKGLLEAYNAIYAPQQEEVVEEVVEEDVEQLDEQGGQRGSGSSASQTNQSVSGSQVASALKGAGNFIAYGSAQGRKPSTLSQPTNVRGGGSRPAAPAPKPASGDYKSKEFAGARDAAFAKAKNIKGSPVVGPGLKGGVTAAPAPATSTATKPPAAAKVAPTRPAAPTKPATGMLGKTSFERRTPTSAELKAAQAARASGASPEKALQAAKSAGTTAKIQAAGQEAGAKAFKAPEVAQTAALAATPKPTPVAPKATGSKKPGSTFEQYDAFDLVLEYLLDNGHVESVDEALYVMLEMDAEVICDIVEEQKATWDKGQKLKDPRAQKVYDKLTGATKLPPA